eukprot:1769599-Rhodomonas_salina.1
MVLGRWVSIEGRWYYASAVLLGGYGDTQERPYRRAMVLCKNGPIGGLWWYLKEGLRLSHIRLEPPLLLRPAPRYSSCQKMTPSNGL